MATWGYLGRFQTGIKGKKKMRLEVGENRESMNGDECKGLGFPY